MGNASQSPWTKDKECQFHGNSVNHMQISNNVLTGVRFDPRSGDQTTATERLIYDYPHL